MKLTKRFDRHVTIVFIATIIVIMATSYFTFNKVIREHINHQQQAIVPLLTLVTHEIVRPLTISHHMANNYFIKEIANAPTADKKQLVYYLESVAAAYDLLAFIAIEKQNLMIDSDGKQTLLSDKKAEWFHRLKELEGNQFADIGNADNPHLYFDIKLTDEENEFLGFIGVAVDLDDFAERFRKFKDRYGYELFVADSNNDITLTSHALMKTGSHHRRDEIVNLSALPWFDSYQNSSNEEHVSQVTDTTGNQYIVSKVAIPELNWNLFLVAPPNYQQSAYWQQFASKALIILLVSFALYFAFDYTINLFKSNLVKDSETDFLTQLPNRSYLNWKIEELRNKHDAVAVVIADIDKFKAINDKYGHLVGDEVLKVIAKNLADSLRKIDVVARWGGEEFIMILPDTECEHACAITERIRQSIEQQDIELTSASDVLNVTVSFGVAMGNLSEESLNDVIQRADYALYQAKSKGRNQVIRYNES
ncbi:sensor domain-containing diguanylate cyclase [Thalassotalea euphylliae]|uniref:sensor domain-containing diguanylate cyclase n=1 Tax=Thalassotalea euphylliae TaxID=1655234 RepID=UPI0036281B8C